MTEKEYLKKLGLKISLARENLGLSRELLASQVQVRRMQIYRIEKGLNPTNILVLRRISSALGISLKKLIDIKDK